MSPRSLPGHDTRVVELRVPGLVGVTGEQLLDSVATVTVDGDAAGELVRPADRMRRPAPGPVLQALGRSLPRTLEGYLWGKMTSGGAVKATWALLFPFSLANVAHGMLPAPTGRPGRVLLGVCRALLRVVGLLLTALLITQLGVISLDLIAAQCLGGTEDCLPWVPGWLRESEQLRMAMGILPPLAVVVAMHRVSVVSWRHAGVRPSAAVRPGGERSGTPRRLAGDVLRPGPNAAILRTLHTVTSLLCVALLPLGGPFTRQDDPLAQVVWIVDLVLLVLVFVAVAALDDVAADLRRVFPRPARAVAVGVAGLLVPAAGFAGSPLGAGRAGLDSMTEGILAALVLAWLGFASLLVPLALTARRGWKDLPHRLRPWLGGWAAAPTVLLACLIGAGFGAGLAISVRELLDASALALPDSYQGITLLWGAGTIAALVLWTGFRTIALPLRRRRRGIPPIVRLLHDDHEDQKEAARAWATAILERKHMHRLVAALALFLAGIAAVLITRRIAGWEVPVELRLLDDLGVVALGVLAAGLLRVVYTAARQAGRSRHLGALADLVFFWPRRAHPIVPPSYALKVVPDLVERAQHHLAEPNTRVVLAGYSHGGLLALIAAARLTDVCPPDQVERLGLITAGTPAQWGYQRAFPSLLPTAELAELFGRLAGRWRGLCRGTDPFGGGVTTWRHQVVAGKLLGVGYTPDGDISPLALAIRGPSSALIIGGDHWLADPVARQPDVDRRWAPGVLRHSDYLVDPEWDHAVAIAAGLARPETAAAKHDGEQTSWLSDLPRLH